MAAIGRLYDNFYKENKSRFYMLMTDTNIKKQLQVVANWIEQNKMHGAFGPWTTAEVYK